MSLREKTISGAKWSAMATIVIIGLGLVQMTVLARIIDNHQFGLLTVSLVIIALVDTLSDFGIANSIIQRKEISQLELTTLYWLNVGLGIFVFVLVFLLSAEHLPLWRGVAQSDPVGHLRANGAAVPR